MPSMAEIREQYPQYNDMSDGDLARALHKKFYSDMPLAEFAAKIDDPGPVAAGLISAGHWLDKKAAGLRDAVPAPVRSAVDKLGATLGMSPQTDASAYTSGAVDKAMASLREQQPGATFAGDLGPNLLQANPVSMGIMAALDPGTAGERATAAATSYGAGKVGQYVGGKIAQKMAGKGAAGEAAAATRDAANAPRNETIAAARAAGLKLPPSMVNPSLLNSMTEGFSGKIATGQKIAIHNEAAVPKIIRKEFGLPDDAPISRETFQTIRKTAGTAYEQLKQFGRVQTDDEFRAGLGKIAGEYQALKADFPTQANKAIDDLLDDLDKPQFNSSSAVELVKRLRTDGFANVRAFDNPERKALGRVQLGAQNAIEDLLERNLEQGGNAGFLDVFRKARTMIAKAHTVENALEESTGKVVASKFVKDYKKGRLTGGLETIGRTAEAFPRAMQNVNTSMPGVSPLDFWAAATAGVAGHPAMLAGVAARPAARSALTSDTWQKLFAKPPKGMSTADLVAKLLGKHPRELEKLGGLLGLSGLEANR